MNIIMKKGSKTSYLVSCQVAKYVQRFSLVINHLANFDAFIQRGFGDIKKIGIKILCKPFHDIIIIPFSTSLKIIKYWTRKRKVTNM